jgi:hypothetical protein
MGNFVVSETARNFNKSFCCVQALLERNINVYTADEVVSPYLPHREIDVEIPEPVK